VHAERARSLPRGREAVSVEAARHFFALSEREVLLEEPLDEPRSRGESRSSIAR